MKKDKNLTLNNSATEGSKTHARRDASHKSGGPDPLELIANRYEDSIKDAIVHLREVIKRSEKGEKGYFIPAYNGQNVHASIDYIIHSLTQTLEDV